MSDPSPRSADGVSLWNAIREFLQLKTPHTLRESIEEAIDEHKDEGADPDDLDHHERTMLRNMLHLSEQKVGNIAVPRSDIIAIEESCDFATVVERFREAGHSRLPLFRTSLDQVVGMLHVKDAYAVIAGQFGNGKSGGNFPSPADLMRPVLFVPPSMRVIDLLTDMRRTRTHMAIVVDEYGGTDGLVTIEDIVEEIVGEIEDEHDDAEQILLHRQADGSVSADARLDLDDLQKELGVDFIDEELGDEVDTLGGLAFLLAGRVPETGESFVHRNGWTIEIAASDGRRVEKLVLRPPTLPEVSEQA